MEGNIFAEPAPEVELSEAESRFARKQAYERDRIAAWLG